MQNVVQAAIQAVKEHQYSFCKFVSPNDAGSTGGHQAGLYIPKNSIALLFDEPGIKGENKEKIVTLTWHDSLEVECRFIYYGQGSRNEYRITRLGRHFNVNDFVVIVKESEYDYLGFSFSEPLEFKEFMQAFNLSIEETNSLIRVPENINISTTEVKNMPSISSEDYNFKPRARIIKVIGQELISNDVIALVELIKNSYDADSRNIEIELNNIFSTNGEIIIKDDGCGMSHEKVVNVWLEPATPDKKSELDNKYSKCYQRRLLGEKGIGRFAAHRLGDNIELNTRARLECNSSPLNYETFVKIDWNAFTEDKYLDQVPIQVSKSDSPLTFSFSSGTLIKITDIHPWKTTKNVLDAVMKIKSLESPVKPQNLNTHITSGKHLSDPGISINITSNDITLNAAINEQKSLSDLLETAFYKFKAIVYSDGRIAYKYSFDRVDYQDIKRGNYTDNSLAIEADLQELDVEWFEDQPLIENNSPGQFEVDFYAWDLDAAALRVSGLASYYKNIIKPNAGVRIYRDNFRVWPYGEEDNDWLNLDLTRLNAPKDRSVSRNQIFGVIHISSGDNPNLKDQSNREGLIINEQYEHFYHLVNASLALFARERKADKIKIDKVTTTSKTHDIVSESIDELKGKIEINHHQALYQKSVDKIEETYQTRINDILERYMMAAAIGISYTIPIHEMRLRLTSIKHVIEDIERNAEIEDRYLKELAKQVDDTDDIIKAVSSIMSRQKKQKVNLQKVASNIRILKESDLSKHGIEYRVNIIADIDVDAVPGLLNTAVLNLVDNAVYWLRAKKIEFREDRQIFHPQILIEVGLNDEGRAYLSVKDNGNGFDDPFELITEPYYSKKTDGLGIGLYLVNEIMIRLGGRLLGHNQNGAVFTLLF